MGKRIGSIMVLLAFLGAVLLVCGKAQEQDAAEAVYERAQEQDAAEAVYERAQEQDAAEAVYERAQGQDAAEPVKEENYEVDREREARNLRKRQMERIQIESGEETAPAKYCDEVAGAEYTDDLSLLEDMQKTDHHYAYQDGKVYYRQYHADSFQESGLWAVYGSIPDTEKEMVCVDREGVKTVLFRDKGWGDFYLIGDRFYMTESRQIYSVNREGGDRIDHGIGEIKAVDEARHTLLMEMHEGEEGQISDYCVLDCDTGTCKSLGIPSEEYYSEDGYGYWYFEAYQDGWVYVSHLGKDQAKGDIRETILYAISPDGEWQEVTALSSERSYVEYIHQLEVVGDRLFFIFGGYDGSASVYQGGSIISVKRDGTDYRAVRDVSSYERYSSDHYYLQLHEGKIRLHYPCSYYVWPEDGGEEYYWVTAWDVDTGTLYPSEFPALAIGESYADGLYVDEENRVFALPDRTGRIVEVTGPLEDYIEDWPGKIVNVRGTLEEYLEDLAETEDGGQTILRFTQLYYRDGYLYFKAEYSKWSYEESIGWRDGYIRLRTAYYRLEPGKDRAELLYHY